MCGYVSARAVLAMSRVRAFAVLAVLLAAAAGGRSGGGGGGGEALAGLEGLLPGLLAGEDLVQAATAACDILPLDLLFSREHTAELPRLELVEVRRGGRRALRAARAHLAAADWRGRPLTVYVPGWWNTPDDEAARALAAALLTERPVLLILDTRPSFCRGYLSAASRVNAVAHLLYTFIRNLAGRGVRPEDVHLIGFSLGAHVAGLAGRLVREGTGQPVGTITALDPAMPCFRESRYRLRREDAAFVQVVHSSAGVLGLAAPAGHADVYVNGVAVRQPECRGSVECDHNRAWRLYAASVADRGRLAGRRCRGWRELLAGRCAGEPANLGYGCSNTSRGMFLYKSRG